MPIVIALLLGAMAGVIAALCGVGGGVVMVPAFTHFLKLDHKTAVATSLAAIIATAIAATAANARHGLVDWWVAVPAGLAGAVVGTLATDWLRKWSTQTLQTCFALLLISVGVHMLWKALRGA